MYLQNILILFAIIATVSCQNQKKKWEPCDCDSLSRKLAAMLYKEECLCGNQMKKTKKIKAFNTNVQLPTKSLEYDLQYQKPKDTSNHISQYSSQLFSSFPSDKISKLSKYPSDQVSQYALQLSNNLPDQDLSKYPSIKVSKYSIKQHSKYPSEDTSQSLSKYPFDQVSQDISQQYSKYPPGKDSQYTSKYSYDQFSQYPSHQFSQYPPKYHKDSLSNLNPSHYQKPSNYPSEINSDFMSEKHSQYPSYLSDDLLQYQKPPKFSTKVTSQVIQKFPFKLSSTKIINTPNTKRTFNSFEIE